MNVLFGEAFGGAASDVVDGGLVESHAYDGYSVERRVGLAVPASVETMPAGLSRRSRDRAGAAEFRERGLGADPLWVYHRTR